MIRIENANKSFIGKNNRVDALQDVSIHVEPGDVYGIIGFSGAGKSTLLRLVNALERPDSGLVEVNGRVMPELSAKELCKARREIGMVFQQFNLLETKTVEQNVALPLLLQGASQKQALAKAAEMLKFVELEDKAKEKTGKLSGGQKQRVGIARALVTNPTILLCDEATSALDPKTTDAILRLLKKVNRELGITILLITHQMEVIQSICSKVAVMEDGRVIESGRVLEVFGRPQHSITKEFVRSVMPDQIPPSIQEMAFSRKDNFRILRLKFVGESVKKSVISEISKIPGLEVSILCATVKEMEDSVICVFILQLIGQDALIEQAEKLIVSAGVLQERVERNEG